MVLSGWLSIRLAVLVAVVGLFGVVCCRCLLFRCGFPLPLPFWGVLWGRLAVFCGGVVCLLVSCFLWQFGAFGGFAWWLPLLLACGGYTPSLFLASVWGGRITPLKFPKKFFRGWG